MLKTYLNELKNIPLNVDSNEILFYQLILVKLGQIIGVLEENNYDPEEKSYSYQFLKDFMLENNLLESLTISSLNELFMFDIEDVDLNNRNIYITLFNIITEELAIEENVFSHKTKEILLFILHKLNNNNNNNNNFSKEENLNIPLIDIDQLKINKKDYPEIDIEIQNKDYLKEYLIFKNLKPYKCDICGLTSWQNNPLRLYLYSKNKIYSNKNLNNLQFLCPNCYSQIGE